MNRYSYRHSGQRLNGEGRNGQARPGALLGMIFNILLGLVLLAGILLLFPPVTRSTHYDYRVGDVTKTGEEVIAPIQFQVPVGEEVLAEQRAAASLYVHPVYRLDPGIDEQMDMRLDKLYRDLQTIQALDSLETLAQRTDRLMGLNPSIKEDDASLLLEKGAGLLDQVSLVVDSILAGGIIDTRRPIGTGRNGVAKLALIRPDRELLLDADRVLDQEELERGLERRTRGMREWSQETRQAIRSLARVHLLPNCFYDEAETTLRKHEAADGVPTFVPVPKGVRILGENMQVTQEHIDKLLALESAQGVQGHSIWSLVSLYAGRVLILGFLLLLMIRFLLLYRADFFVSSRRVLLLTILTLLFMFASKYALQVETGGAYLLPVVFVALIMAGLYDVVLAVMTVLFSIVLLMASTTVPVGGIVVALLAGGTSVFSMRAFRSRLQLYQILAYVTLAYLIGLLGVHMALGRFQDLPAHWLRGGLNGIICSMLVLPILPLLERFFDLTTNFTLLELTDLNRPILKRMKVEAPGTFQHSLAVSNLAEAAADAIGVNALLAKVCAYYHDIGKLKKPDYFTENQRGQRNKHEKLTPNMSALIIAKHVKEGQELAEKIKLPSIVSRGIPEHHGTTVMKYFYHKAVESDPHGKVREDDFRYGGPKPQSAETAILMLADSVEAMARSLDSPSTAKIRSMVKEAIDVRMADGELEECGLSLRELAMIRESFVTTLLSIYHPRIQYPSDKKTLAEDTTSTEDRTAGKDRINTDDTKTPENPQNAKDRKGAEDREDARIRNGAENKMNAEGRKGGGDLLSGQDTGGAGTGPKAESGKASSGEEAGHAPVDQG